MPKADRVERPAKKRNRALKYSTQTSKSNGNRYRELFLAQDRKDGLTGESMNETDDIYVSDGDDILALKVTLDALYGSYDGWTSVDVSDAAKQHTLIEEYDHYEAWNPTVS